MKIKNEDGTINALPIAGTFTVLAIALYLLLFGLDIKEKIENKIEDMTSTTTTTAEKTTMTFCTDCTMNFIADSFDVSLNADLDLLEIIKLYKISINYITFESSDPDLVTIAPYHSTMVLKTGVKTGTATLKAIYKEQVVQAVINVVSTENAKVGFKYDSYFVKRGKAIEPDIVTYPYGVNLNNIKYCTYFNKEAINCSAKSNKVSGKKVGSSRYSVELNKSKASTTIYVVNNIIDVKVNEDGTFKVAREIKPLTSVFDIKVEFESNKDEKFDNRDLELTFDSNPLGATVEYVAPDKSSNTYIYRITLAEGTTGTSVMRVKLSDGSFTLFKIIR